MGPRIYRAVMEYRERQLICKKAVITAIQAMITAFISKVIHTLGKFAGNLGILTIK